MSDFWARRKAAVAAEEAAGQRAQAALVAEALGSATPESIAPRAAALRARYTGLHYMRGGA